MSQFFFTFVSTYGRIPICEVIYDREEIFFYFGGYHER